VAPAVAFHFTGNRRRGSVESSGNVAQGLVDFTSYTVFFTLVRAQYCTWHGEFSNGSPFGVTHLELVTFPHLCIFRLCVIV
jgi:hypothetical protein